MSQEENSGETNHHKSSGFTWEKSRKYLTFSPESSVISSPIATSPGVKDEVYLREKVFTIRESAFTIVLENSREAKAVYAMASSQLFLLMIYTIIKYFVHPQTYSTDLQFITSQLTGMTSFFTCELIMHLSVILLIYPLTKLWMSYECKYFTFYLLSILPAFTLIICHPVYTLIEYKFLYLLTFSLTVEQVSCRNFSKISPPLNKFVPGVPWTTDTSLYKLILSLIPSRFI